MKKYIKYILTFFFLFLGNFCYAAWNETTSYWCTSGCGGNIVRQVCYSSCSCGEDAECSTRCSDISIVATANPWQVCVGGTQVYTRGRTCPPDAGNYRYWSSKNKFYFICSGKCLPNVSDIRYYNNPNYPQQPELTISGSDDYPPYCSDTLKKDCIEPSDNSSDNVKLPFKIDWDEDPYWMSSSSSPTQFADKLIANSNYEKKWTGGPQSYILKLELNSNIVSSPTKADSGTFSDYISKDFTQDEEEIKQGYFEKLLNLDNQPSYIPGGNYRSSEYNFRVDHNPCWLKSGENYNLTIQTCCNADGTNCNDGGSFNFTTSYAPELKSPEDLDWEGSNAYAWNSWPLIDSEDKLPLNNEDYNPFDWEKNNPANYSPKIKPPVLLDWCDLDSAKLENRKTNSYSILPKIFETIPGTNETQKVCAFNKGITDELCYHISNPLTRRLFTEYSDINNYLFTKNSTHSWKVKGCPTAMAGICTLRDYSQEWYFTTDETDLGNSSSITPFDGAIVGLPVNISWARPAGYVSNIFEIYKGETLIEKKEMSESGAVYDNLDLNTTYSWKSKNCTDRYYKKCDAWSPLYKFTITGNPPELISPRGDILPPFDFTWNRVSGANAYIFKIEGGEINKEIKVGSNYLKLEYSSDFPFKVNSTYNWQVKTCADNEGLKCGEYSAPLSFTIKLEAPNNLKPSNKTLSLYEDSGFNLEWEAINGIKTYELSFSYSKGKEETSKMCENLYDENRIITNNKYFFAPKCLGFYTWKVRSCFSENCAEGTFSDWSSSGALNIYQNINPETGEKVSEENKGVKSIVPCGRNLDDPDTSWNERESCTFPHFLIIIRNIIDFILWRLIPLLLATYAVYSGVVIFTAFGNTNAITQVKSMWKYIGIGIMIVFFSWTLIDLFLSLIGYNVGVFGVLVK